MNDGWRNPARMFGSCIVGMRQERVRAYRWHCITAVSMTRIYTVVVGIPRSNGSAEHQPPAPQTTDSSSPVLTVLQQYVVTRRYQEPQRPKEGQSSRIKFALRSSHFTESQLYASCAVVPVNKWHAQQASAACCTALLVPLRVSLKIGRLKVDASHIQPNHQN